MGQRIDSSISQVVGRTILFAIAIAIASLLVVAPQAAVASKSVVGWAGSPSGASSTPPNGFNQPTGLAVNDPSVADASVDPFGDSTDGYVYVADKVNHAIRVLDADLEPVFMFGGAVNQTSGGNVCPRPGFPADACGIGNQVLADRGYFDDPAYVAIDQADGSVYVSDQDNLRVQKFTAAGEFLYMIGKGVNETDPTARICPRPGNEADACKVGVSGSEGGEFSTTFTADVGVVPAAAPNGGNLLVGDRGNRRVAEFGSDGSFIRTFGWDVVKTGGAGNVSGNEVQKVTIAAGGGTFTLSFTQTTAPIKYDATAAEVEAALEALAAVDDVEVTGGPGDPSGSNPYEITFVGTHADANLPQLGINITGLRTAVGSTVECISGTSNQVDQIEDREYRWLRGGQPIPGADEATYTITAADEGDAVQCEVSGKRPAEGSTNPSRAMAISNPIGVAPGTTLLPVPPSFLSLSANPSPEVGGGGGSTIGPCGPGSWQNGASGYAYRWYVNGEVVPGEELPTYVATADDVREPGNFQCVITGTNAGGTVAKASSPRLFGVVATTVTVSVPTEQLGGVETVTDGGGFEVCTVASDCKAGAPFNTGEGLGQFGNNEPASVAADSSGAIFALEANNPRRIQRFADDEGSLVPSIWGPSSSSSADRAVFLDVTADDEVLLAWYTGAGTTAECPDGSPSVSEYRVRHYSNDGEDLLDTDLACAGFNLAARGIAEADGLLYASTTQANSTTTNRVWVAAEDLAPSFGVSEVIPSQTSAVVEGEVIPNSSGSFANPPRAMYRVQYRLAGESEWNALTAPKPAGAGTSPIPTRDEIPDLLPNSEYEVRLVGHKEFGGPGGESAIRPVLTAAAPPAIDAMTSTDLSATGATLRALIDPRGSATDYYIEWGPTTDYGNVTPTRSIGAGQGAVEVSEELTGLQGTTYHFRVVATNDAGTVTSPNQSFNFYPEKCPNELVRQQTKAQFLPDCRAYEIASAADAGGMILLPASGVSSGEATSPSRLAYSGAFGSTPGAGEPINYVGDLYVSTRGTEGWTTKYVGLPPTESAYNGPRPGKAILEGGLALQIKLAFSQRDVLTDRSMSRFVNWNRGNPSVVPNPYWSNAPFVWSATGERLERWPTNLAAVEGGERFRGQMRTSADLEHFVFSSDIPFTGDGQPGDIYDNDIEAGTVVPISRDENGDPFLGDPVEVSDDGSRILMAGAPTPACSTPNTCPPVPQAPLYMRAGGETFDVTDGEDVRFAGMTDDGSIVYFTSEARITSDDDDDSTDLFVWRLAAPEQIERVSVGIGGAGDTDACAALEDWIQGCGAVPVSQWSQTCGPESSAPCTEYPRFFSEYAWAAGGRGGNGKDDNFVAEDSGDIYFISPETLLGPGKGLEGFQNLYLYRDGELRFVTRLSPQVDCIGTSSFDTVCSEFGIARMQVTPDGRYAAFVTKSRVTSFDNDGQAMMYRYDADRDRIECLSCSPTGAKPTSRALGSQNGRFITDDGRAFFSTEDGLVPRDTNGAPDVYEYVGGRAQLISQGTGPKVPQTGLVGLEATEGLVAVNRDGVDVYFSTFDVLTPFDRNGGNLKIYDARVNGGFRYSEPLPGCEAADECHGDSSRSAPLPVRGTTADLGDSGDVREANGNRCAARGKKAKRAARRAKSARRALRRAAGPARAKKAKRARQLTRKARRANKQAKRCRATASRADSRTEVGR